MRICPECEGKVSDEFDYCPLCGHQFEDDSNMENLKETEKEEWWEDLFSSVVDSLDFSDSVTSRVVSMLSNIMEYKPGFFEDRGLVKEIPAALYFAYIDVNNERLTYSEVTEPLGFSIDVLKLSIERWQEEVFELIDFDVVNPYLNYSDSEREYIKENYSSMPTEDIAEHLKRSGVSIASVANNMGVRKEGYGYNDKQEKFIKEYYGYWDPKVIAELLSKTKKAVYSKARRLGVTEQNESAKSSGKRWTDSEEEFMRENYSDMSSPEVADLLGRSKGAIRQKAYKMGLT